MVDITNVAGVAFGVFYIPLVATAVFHRDPHAPWWLAALACALVVVGFFFPSIGAEPINGLVNRALSIVAIVTTAYLIHHERRIRDQLVEQTARAEAADRAKSMLFNNLSHELRTPLAAILGFADLLSVSARQEQRAPLGHIQSGGKRLLATLDNLIDLTQIEDRPVRVRPVDLSTLLQQAVDAVQPLAADKQVALSLALSDARLPRAVADSWAVRRIVDNLIANGIKFTQPGGSVDVSARNTPDGIVTTVRDTGAGMPPEVLTQLGAPFYQADSGIARHFEGMGTGLALSLRLADAMGAALHFDSVPGSGTVATLILPQGE